MIFVIIIVITIVKIVVTIVVVTIGTIIVTTTFRIIVMTIFKVIVMIIVIKTSIIVNTIISDNVSRNIKAVCFMVQERFGQLFEER